MSIAETKRVRDSAVSALKDFIGVMEPEMPDEERGNLAEGLLSIVVEWSAGGVPLPESVRERLTLDPWNRKR